MRIKAKETLAQAQPAPAPEAEAAPPPKAKHAKGPQPRPPRSQMAGGWLLYRQGGAMPAADTMCDEHVHLLEPPAPEPEPVETDGTGGADEAEGDDRMRHLAMAGGQTHPLLRRPIPKPAATLAPVRPGSRLACERRCGGAGCDPANSHGCGGVFCLDPLEQL